MKFAIRESIECDNDDFEYEEDPVPEILPKHFENAMRESRRSVSDADLMKYQSYSMSIH